MRKLTIAILLISLSLVLIGGVFQRHALACEFLPLMNVQQIRSEVYLASEFPEDQARIMAGFIDSASERINHVYGEPASRPRFVFTNDASSAGKWGANETASMHRLPWRACIIIGPEGQSIDVIAHEWLHAEIQHRVGFFRFLGEIPVWFDEGAALTLDYREPFLPENIDLTDTEIAAVKNLKSGRRFFSGSIRQNFQAARLVVDPLIQNEQFFSDLDRVGSGESFERVFLNAHDSMQPAANASAD